MPANRRRRIEEVVMDGRHGRRRALTIAGSLVMLALVAAPASAATGGVQGRASETSTQERCGDDWTVTHTGTALGRTQPDRSAGGVLQLLFREQSVDVFIDPGDADRGFRVRT